MAIVGETFKFEEEGFSCDQFKGVVPYEKFVSIEKYKLRYTIKYLNEKGKNKLASLEISEQSHQSVDDFLKKVFPNMNVVESKQGFFTCLLPSLIIPAIYAGLYLSALWFKYSDIESLSIPIIIYPLFEFMVDSAFSTNILIIVVLVALSCVRGLFSYKKNNVVFKYNINLER